MFEFKKRLHFILISLVILVSIIYTIPFFKQGYFETDDGIWALVRQSEMLREIKDGQIPPRWSDYLNHGYGYPLFNFTYPFPYYLGSVLKLFGFSTVTSVKTLFIVSVVLSGIFMFYLGSGLFGSVPGFIAAVFYLTSPYRIIDLYQRGSIGESLSFALFPLIFLLTLNYSKNPKKITFILLAFSLTVEFLTHNVMSLFFMPFWMLFAGILSLSLDHKLTKKILSGFFAAFILAVSLASYFILPAIIEKKYIYLSLFSLADKAYYYYSLQDLAAMISWPLILSVLLTFFNFNNLKKINKIKFINVYLILIILFISASFLTLKISSIFWSLPLLKEVDFPRRIMGVVMFVSSLLTVFIPKKNLAITLGIVLIIINFALNFRLIPDLKYFNKADDYFATNDATTTSKDELTPVWVQVKPKNRYLKKIEITEGEAEISDLYFNSQKISLSLMAQKPGTAVINTIYYPGWEIKVNNRIVPINYNNPRGLINISFPAGKSIITGKFQETNIRLFSDFLSLISLFIVILYLYAKKI